MDVEIKLPQLVSAFSLMLDVAENKPFEHGKRIAYICMAVAEKMGLSEQQISNLFYAAMLHDIGATGTGMGSMFELEEKHLVFNSNNHAVIGYTIVSKMPFDSDVPNTIRYHHEFWNGTGAVGLCGNEIPITAQIVALADKVDVNFDLKNISYKQRPQIINYVNEKSDQFFNPQVVHAFLAIAKTEKFWLDVGLFGIDTVVNKFQPVRDRLIHMEDFLKIAEAFALVVDSKSKYMSTHSRGVAQVVRRVAQNNHFDDGLIKKLAVAAYLHDLGKLAVPNSILDKPSALSDEEMQMIKSHPYYTRFVLSQIKGIDDITDWAAHHHEKFNGSGYPEGIKKDQLSEYDQLVAMSDIYQAMTEDRPYRRAFSEDQAFELLNQMVLNDHFEQRVFDLFAHGVHATAVNL